MLKFRRASYGQPKTPLHLREYTEGGPVGCVNEIIAAFRHEKIFKFEDKDCTIMYDVSRDSVEVLLKNKNKLTNTTAAFLSGKMEENFRACLKENK